MLHPHRWSGAIRLGSAVLLAIGVLLSNAAFAQQPAATAARELPNIADVVDKVINAVVYISTTSRVEAPKGLPQPPPGSPFEEFFDDLFKKRGEGNGEQSPQRRQSSLGSGFVIDPSGIVVTNNHVIEGAEEIFVSFNDTTRLQAEVIGRDSKIDLAVLRVKSDKPLPAVSFGNSDTLRLGEWVIAIGNPFGLGGTVTLGIVSARNRDISSGPYDNFIQTDAAINRGNSGGPLFNLQGEVIGINTAIISPSGGSIGIGFAVPAATAAPVISQLREFGETRRGWLGVRIQSVTDDIAETLAMGKARGAMISGVVDGGPASKAGLKIADVIVRFDGQEVRGTRELQRIVAATPIGRAVDVVVLRDGKEQTTRVTVERLDESEKQADAGSKPAPTPAPPERVSKVLGLELAPLSDTLRQRFRIKDSVKGVVVTAVERGSPAADKGIQAGQVIVDVERQPVSTPGDVQRRIEDVRKAGRRSVLLMVAGPNGDGRFVAISLK